MEIEELQATWRLLERPAQDAETPARELSHIDLPYKPTLLTVDGDDRRHLLLAIPEDLAISTDTDSSGIHIVESRWGYEGETRRFLDVLCLKSHLIDVFNLLVLDIFDAAQDDPYHPDRAARNTLQRWREFIEQVRETSLDTTILIGLYGELWLLRELVRQNPRALKLWRGPFGERYDFYGGKTAIEVKTTRQRKGRTLTIHGHDQLEDPPSGSLFLARLQVELGPSAAESLEDMIMDLSELGCDMRVFHSALLHCGFTRDKLSERSSIRFNLLDFRVYKVNDLFPRITSSSFKNEVLPPGIVSIEYTLDLTAQPPYPLSKIEYEQLVSQLVGEVS